MPAPIEHQTIDVLHTIPIERATVPASIINFVTHTQQSLVLDDAAQGDYATHDPYIREQRPHSVLCMPLIHHGNLVGVLYLENNLATGVFTAERLEVLRLLSGQVAISIENARLYQQMQTLVSDLQCSRDELALAYDATLEGWVRMLDLRDNETWGHSQRVTRLTVRLAQAIGIAEDELVDIYRGALLHDIGKMAIPDPILHKPGPLTDNEWAQMRQHPVHAYEALWPIDYLRRALDIPYCHHERWDGTGYPRGLRGDAIPLAARIFAVIDVWDALRSDRPYRAAWPDAQVRAYIAEHAGTHFDPAVVVAFFRLLDTTDASDLIAR
jgi:HD-GYP domain-containing protein (c-di-GMP phosphodiesterase class II)